MNQDLEFGCCDRCGCAMIRTGKGWSIVPKGYRIIWRNRADPRDPDRRHGTVDIDLLHDKIIEDASIMGGISGHPAVVHKTKTKYLNLFIAGISLLVWYTSDRALDWHRRKRPNAARIPRTIRLSGPRAG